MSQLQSIYTSYLSSTGICTDTRAFKKGSLFIALKGANFNGNDFVEEALEKECIGVVSDRQEFANHKNVFVVNNTLKTLQDLANLHRKTLGIPIIAITGSNGKTTTKELLTAALATTYNTFSTPGNFNNHIGLPLSILMMDKQVEIAILEMGDSQEGDVLELCEIAEPNTGIVTNIGKDHIGGFGSMEANIRAKKELFDWLDKNNKFAFIRKGDAEVEAIAPDSLQLVRFGSDEDQYQLKIVEDALFFQFESESGLKYETKLIGSYNIQNAGYAYSISRYYDVPETRIKQAFEDYEPKNNRSQLLETENNTLILDCYNANPSSVELALENLRDIKRKDTTIVLGDMLELGDISDEEHQRIRALAESLKPNHLLLLGNEFGRTVGSDGTAVFSDKEKLVDHIKALSINNHLVLLKGSRGMKLETLVESL